MDIAIEHPKFEGKNISVRTAGFFRGPSLLLDGKRLSRTKGVYHIRNNQGQQSQVTVKYNYLDPVPVLVIDDEEMILARPLQWYEYLWLGLPALLIFIGGALGGLCGGIAFYLNVKVFRSDLHIAAKYVLTGIVSFVAVILFFIVVAVVVTLLGGVEAGV